MFPTIGQTPNPESETGREQVRRLLERAVDELAEPFRMVFILRDVQGLSTAETAEALSIRPETVKTRLHRARAMMRASLERSLAPRFGDLFPFDGERCASMGRPRRRSAAPALNPQRRPPGAFSRGAVAIRPAALLPVSISSARRRWAGSWYTKGHV